MFFSRKPMTIPDADRALPGRAAAMATSTTHAVNGHELKGPYPAGLKTIAFGMGCFWGAERKFWQIGAAVHVTAVGYAGGTTPNPTYGEVCSGQTGHNEVVRVVFDPAAITLETILKTFWENHDPTQGMRQGNDSGTQYRSGIYLDEAADEAAAFASRDAYASQLRKAGYGPITTEIVTGKPFYFAEAEHQQYLAKNPRGYCGMGGTGVSCPIGATAA